MSNLEQTVVIDDKAYDSLSIGGLWLSLEEATRTRKASAFEIMEEVGSLLGELFFPADAKSTDRLIEGLALAQRDNTVLRLRFVGNAARLPVEFTTLSTDVLRRCRTAGIAVDDAAIGLHSRIEIVRDVVDCALESSVVEVSQKHPLRILIAVANPGYQNWPTIPRAEPQARIIESACKGIAGDFADVTYLADASPQSLAKALEESRPHILHFVGHGANTSDGTTEPSLVLASDQGQGVDFLSAKSLLACCSEIPQLISLNACHLGGSDPLLRGFAEELSNAGVPVVLAMQLPVDDTVAEHIAEGVYRPLLRGLPVSQALANVRRQFAIDSRLRHHPQWATPVLFSRVSATSRFKGVPVSGIAESRARSAAHRFVGREWLWGKVKPYLESPHNAVVLLEAEAGLGKSSFMEHCLRELETAAEKGGEVRGSVSLLLSYRYRYGEQADAAACARALSAQLVQWLEDNGITVPEEPAPDAYGSPYVRACAILDELIAATTEHTHVVLLIDALDEASDARDALPITGRLGSLPHNLSVFATTRPEWYTQWQSYHPANAATQEVAADNRFSAISLEPLSTANMRDVAYLIYQSFQPYGIAINQAACLALAKNVRGSFLVADILLGMLRTGDDEAQIQSRFNQADSVTGAYDLVFRTLAADLIGDADAERKLQDTEDLLAFIACARDPVTDEQFLQLFRGRVEGLAVDCSQNVADALNHLRRFLSSDLSEYGEQLYRPYHLSLRTYGERRLGFELGLPMDVESKVDPSLPLRQALPRSAEDYRRIWAEYCLRWKELDRYPAVYALRHVVPHLVALEGDKPVGEIETLLTDYTYIAAALGANPNKPERPLHVNELIAHYDSAERRRSGTN